MLAVPGRGAREEIPMTETTWAADAADQPVKKSLPKWVWFCGGGCLLALLAVVGLFAWGAIAIKNASDPVKNEAELQKVLPHDPLPPTMQLMFHSSIGMEQFVIQDSRQFQLQIQVHEGSNAGDVRKQMFESEKPQIPENVGGMMRFADMSKGTVEVQGREIPVLRMRMEFTGVAKDLMPKEAEEKMGPMLFADVTPEGVPDRVVLLQLTKQEAAERVTDDEVRDLLAPFHIGPDR